MVLMVIYKDISTLTAMPAFLFLNPSKLAKFRPSEQCSVVVRTIYSVITFLGIVWGGIKEAVIVIDGI